MHKDMRVSKGEIMRVKMVKTMAPVEIPNGTEGTVVHGDINSGMAKVAWDNGYVLPMYSHEVTAIADEVL